MHSLMFYSFFILVVVELITQPIVVVYYLICDKLDVAS